MIMFLSVFQEFIIYCVMTVFFLIAAIVAAAKGGWHESIGASAVSLCWGNSKYIIILE